MEAQQEPTKAGAVVAPSGVAGQPAGGGGVLENGPPAPAEQGPAAPGSATDRDAVLAKVDMERKLSMVKAWEENQKSKADNRAEHKMSSILSWENTKKAAVEAKLRTRDSETPKPALITSLPALQIAAKFSPFVAGQVTILPQLLFDLQEKLEKKKAEYAEKMRNRIATIHKEAEEQRAALEAMRQQEMIKCQETAAKHRSKGTTPKKKFLGCFG